MDRKIITIINTLCESKGRIVDNTIDIKGKPLIGWSIEQSINSDLISNTYILTDNSQIAEIAKQFGAEVLWQPEDISEEESISEYSIIHALTTLKNDKQVVPDYIVLLQPASPLRKANDIDNAILKIISDDADSLFSTLKSNNSLFWEMDGNKLKSTNYDYLNRGSIQGLLPQLIENESIYITKPDVLIRNNNRLGGKISAYEMESWQNLKTGTIDEAELVGFFINKKLLVTDLELFKQIGLLVYDFDGVMTDNKVSVDQYGNESVTVNRGDGLAIAEIKKLGIPQLIISTEKNVVVQKRAEKLSIPCLHGIENKKNTLLAYTNKNKIDLDKIAFIGNDINDYDVMKIVGIPIAPSDAHKTVKDFAKFVTNANGGNGVIRELYDLIKLK